MTIHRVLVFGGRDFNDMVRVSTALEQFRDKFVAFNDQWCVIQGKANGADRCAENWAVLEGVACISVAANWLKYPRAAGPIRNRWMLDFCMPTYGIGFPGGKGTADMAKRLTDAGIPVWRPYED